MTEEISEKLTTYYQMVMKWNKHLHLTTITDPDEFKKLHIDESQFAGTLLIDTVRELWDLGTGLGVPGIPISIYRPDLKINLVELNRSKSIFLEEVLAELNLKNVVVHRRDIKEIDCLLVNSALTARAVEKMESLIPEFFRIGADSDQLLIFGSENLGEHINKILTQYPHRTVKTHLIAKSHNRYIFEIS